MSQTGVILSLFLVLSTCTSAFTLGGQTLDRGDITGVVEDETGAFLVGATVTLRETNTGFERTTVTGPGGQYSGLLLPLGRYIVEAQFTGFSSTRSAPVVLGVGEALVVNLTMGVAAVLESVHVMAAADIAPTLGVIVGDQAIANLPIGGRDYRDFALLAPTARAITGTRGTFRVGGQPGDYLGLNVDGSDFTNNLFGEFFGSLETKNLT